MSYSPTFLVFPEGGNKTPRSDNAHYPHLHCSALPLNSSSPSSSPRAPAGGGHSGTEAGETGDPRRVLQDRKSLPRKSKSPARILPEHHENLRSPVYNGVAHQGNRALIRSRTGDDLGFRKPPAEDSKTVAGGRKVEGKVKRGFLQRLLHCRRDSGQNTKYSTISSPEPGHLKGNNRSYSVTSLHPKDVADVDIDPLSKPSEVKSRSSNVSLLPVYTKHSTRPVPEGAEGESNRTDERVSVIPRESREYRPLNQNRSSHSYCAENATSASDYEPCATRSPREHTSRTGTLNWCESGGRQYLEPPRTIRRFRSRVNVAGPGGASSFQEKRILRRSLPDLGMIIGQDGGRPFTKRHADTTSGGLMFISLSPSHHQVKNTAFDNDNNNNNNSNNSHQRKWADTNRKSNPETVEATSVTSPATRPVSLASTTTSTTTTTTTTAVSTNSPTTTTTTTTSNHNSPRDGGAEDLSNSSGGEASADIKKPSPMAFTIELGNTTSGGVETPAKKLDITASISKWAPKHRRNLSLTKVEENKKVEERIGKPPVGRPRSGTIGATGLMQTQGRRAGGYHSEGYFSSDQDDEIPRRTDLKSPRSPRTPELRSPQTPQRVVRSSSQDSAKGASLKKTAGKPEGRTCCKSDKKPTVAEVTGRAKSEKGTKSTSKMTPEARKQSNSANSLSSCQTYDVKQELERNVPGKEEKDDVSEAGTYTIEKDSSSPEVEQARNDIDRVFGVSGTESETEITPRANMQPDETWTATPEPDKFKSPGSLSRNSPNWIQQWAAQVAEHTKSPDTSSKISLASPRGLKPPMASLSSSQESSESRPRRKLPTPPTHHSPFALTSPRASDMSDHESPTKGSKHRRELYETPCGGQHESSFNTESFLRETEQLVTSLQARVDMNKGISPGLRGSSFESRDSGGDSDLDTSTSYPINDDDDHLMKTVGLQLKTKLKLSGIGDATKTPPVVASPRKNDPLGLETRLKLANNFKRERSIVSDSGYEVYANRREENSLQSDSSSEASEPVKDSRKTIDNNPPLKFNRAFSLRRARLTCDDSSQQHQSPSPLDKKKNTRPVTSGNLSGNRKVPLGSSKSHQNHQSSDSTRGGSHSHIPTSKGGSTDFSRGDGGRFSLRLPRSGSSNTVSKSPSHTSVRKELSSNSRRGTPRSNSTLSAKEVDFQNWKRRKNYDPMKAAAEGRKKVTDKKSDKTNQCHSLNAPERGTPSPPGSLLRSASFHGTEGMAVSGRWPRRPNHLYTSEDDGPYSLEEEHPRRVPNCSPLRRSPTSPHQLASPHTTSPARQATLAAARARRSSFTHSDEGEGQPASPNRKTSLDESGSEGKRSPMGSTRGTVSSRSKAKMEALDNLVISTIHSLSVKVRTTSETLLQKLKSQYDEEGDRAALLEEVLAHLSESDQTLVTGQSRSTSRELAGILRNLKKIEHALEVIDRVMVCDDEDDLDEDDLDGTVGQEWGSDY